MKPLSLSVAAALFVLGLGTAQAAAEPTVINLSQVGCQFLESEHDVNRGYTPKTADDCRKINADKKKGLTVSGKKRANTEKRGTTKRSNTKKRDTAQ